MNLKSTIGAAVFALSLVGGSAYGQSCCSGGAKPPTVAQTKTVKGVQKVTVKIDGGYTPSTINAKVGKPLAITFIRTEKMGCGDQVVFKSLGIKKSVAKGAKIVIKFTPKKAGVITFTCGMGMYKGKVVVK